MNMTSFALAQWLDGILNIQAISDDSLNGLQVANSGKLSKVALAVDVSETAIRHGGEIGADFLLVHHGLFWGKPERILGPLYQRIRLLIEHDMALYAVHLPLDMHPEYGNNVGLIRAFGWEPSFDVGELHGQAIGKAVILPSPVSLDSIIQKWNRLFNGEPRVWSFGPQLISRIAVVSGGALVLLDELVKSRFDLFITGEPKHSGYWFAREAGIHVIFGGHYATETFGVKMLGEVIQKKWKIETVFLDHPTGY